MKTLKNSVKAIVSIALLVLFNVQSINGMPLRSFVALPIDKYGYIVRFSYEHPIGDNRASVNTSMAYGLSNDQALLIGIPYKVKPKVGHHLGDFSALYRHTLIQDDFFSGTSRLAWLVGAIIPSDNDRDLAVQSGFVYTFFKGRNEIDIDILYQAGVNNRLDSGRYDISWQYRLSPSSYPTWGIASELNSVIELNGRWTQGSETIHQVTLGLQLINSTWVIEAGIIQDINNKRDSSFLISTRYHF